MADEVSSQVVGGYKNPRFLLAVPLELSPNVGFEESAAGWTNAPGVTIARAFDSSTPFGDYVLTIEDLTETTLYDAFCVIDAGEAIASQRFVITFWVRNDADQDGFFFTYFQQQDGSPVPKTYSIGQDWRQITEEVVIRSDTGAVTEITMAIGTSAYAEGTEGTGKIRIDHFRVRKVVDAYELPIPDRGKMTEIFNEELQSRIKLSNKTEVEYSAGYKYFYQAEYDQITAAQEILRRRSRTSQYDVMFFPHKDSPQCYFVRWDDDLEVGWAFGAATFGHAGNIALKSIEVTPFLPIEVIDAGNEYSPPDDILVYGEDLYY